MRAQVMTGILPPHAKFLAQIKHELVHIMLLFQDRTDQPGTAALTSLILGVNLPW